MLAAVAAAALALVTGVNGQAQTISVGCTPVDADPFPHSFKSIAMAEGSNWYLSNFGRPMQGVHLFNITDPSTALIPLNASIVISRPPCVSVSATVNSVCTYISL